MDRLVAIKIKYTDNTYSEEIPIGAFAKNIIYQNVTRSSPDDDTVYNLQTLLGEIDPSNTIQSQISDTVIRVGNLENNRIRYFDNEDALRSAASELTNGMQVAVLENDRYSLYQISSTAPVPSKDIEGETYITIVNGSKYAYVKPSEFGYVKKETTIDSLNNVKVGSNKFSIIETTSQTPEDKPISSHQFHIQTMAGADKTAISQIAYDVNWPDVYYRKIKTTDGDPPLNPRNVWSPWQRLTNHTYYGICNEITVKDLNGNDVIEDGEVVKISKPTDSRKIIQLQNEETIWDLTPGDRLVVRFSYVNVATDLYFGIYDKDYRIIEDPIVLPYKDSKTVTDQQGRQITYYDYIHPNTLAGAVWHHQLIRSPRFMSTEPAYEFIYYDKRWHLLGEDMRFSWQHRTARYVRDEDDDKTYWMKFARIQYPPQEDGIKYDQPIRLMVAESGSEMWTLDIKFKCKPYAYNWIDSINVVDGPDNKFIYTESSETKTDSEGNTLTIHYNDLYRYLGTNENHCLDIWALIPDTVADNLIFKWASGSTPDVQQWGPNGTTSPDSGITYLATWAQSTTKGTGLRLTASVTSSSNVVTISDPKIKSNSIIDVYADRVGVVYTNISVPDNGGSVQITFDATTVTLQTNILIVIQDQ